MSVEKVSKEDLNDVKESVQEEKDFNKAMKFMQDDSLCYPQGENKESCLDFKIGEPIGISKSLLKKLRKNGDIE